MLIPSCTNISFSRRLENDSYSVCSNVYPRYCVNYHFSKTNGKETELQGNRNLAEKSHPFFVYYFYFLYVLSGLDFRYGWTQVPVWLVLIACIVFILTYIGFVVLLKQNEYLSRIVEVQENQHVIDTGMYGVVRHPMYFVILFMFLSMPLIIGSFVGLIPLIVLPIILVKRIKDEEEVLEKGLTGYSEYKKKVRYRMIPFIW